MRVGPDETGASSVEYALILVAIAAVITVVVLAVGQIVQGTYQGTCDSLAAENGETGC